MMDEAMQYLEKVERLIAEYGPTVADAGLTALRIDAASQLLTGLLALLVAIAIPSTLYYLWQHKRDWVCCSYRRDEASEPFILLGLLSLVGACGFLLAAFVQLLTIWHWVGLFNPELYAIWKFAL